MEGIILDRITQRYGATVALADVSIEIPAGEFLVLLGPSGCGKSTLLRLIAGLLAPTAGRVIIDDADVTALAPGARNIAMVFQSYALYPHLSVRRNLGFGLRVRHRSREEIRAKVDAVAGQLQLADLLDRKPKALSGGQRQRVALGRAMVADPKAFLMDEPLSNLDAQLRTATRLELAELHRRLGTTFVYVTHDQVEAMTMATRIAVLNGGRIDQVLSVDGLRVVALDSTVPGHPHGELEDAQLEWLAAELATPAPRGTIVAVHHPPIGGPAEFGGIITLHGPERLAEVIKGTDVLMIVAGHTHHASAGALGGVPVWVATATAYQMDVLAAGVDGQNSWRTLWTVVVPNLGPALSALGILLFVSSWNEYFWPLLVYRNINYSVLQLGLQGFLNAVSINYGGLMAAAGLATLPILAIYAVLQRRMVNAFVRSGLR